MQDLISRADVEQTVEDDILCYTHSDRPIDQDPDTECDMAIRMALRMLRKDLRKLPSAQPERKTGHWIKTARWGRVYYCDQCRNYLDFDGVNVGRGSANFCPNCGADMRGEQDG